MKKVNENYAQAFGRLINVKDIMLFDSRRDIDKDEYEEYLECNEMTEEDESFYDYCNNTREEELEDFWANLKYDTKFNNEDFLITGHLGLWHGRPEIVPVKVYGLHDAISKCAEDAWDIDVTLCKDGSIMVCGHHHDGTNVFFIRRLSQKGRKAVQAADDRWDDYEPKKWWFNRFYIDEIEF